MSQEHLVHARHEHSHGPGCGHIAIEHEAHIDYLHDGHLHNIHGDHVDECTLPVTDTNQEGCTPRHLWTEHTDGHTHGKGCGHQVVPHGEHLDYLVGSHLHYPHDGHCDDHGAVKVV